MREVGIVGVGHTNFGKFSGGTFIDMISMAAVEALDDAGIKLAEGQHGIDQVFVATMGAGILNKQSGIASALVDTLNLRPAMAETVENGPASGASAIKLGYMAIASGMCDAVLVVGGEMMRVVSGWEGTDFVATMLHPEAEYNYGITLPTLAGMFTRLCMEKYGITEKDLAIVSVKNHENALHNPVAHLHIVPNLYAITEDEDAGIVNPYVASPLRLYSVCPVSDGAAAVLLCAMDKADRFAKKPVKIAGIGQATDTHAVAEREVSTDLLAVRLAAQNAYEMAGLKPEDIDVAELHDAFQILEIVESEEVGFFKRGEGHIAARNGETKIGGKIPINTSGGLKAKGHPLGATGVSQVVEIVKQLRGEATGRQVKDAKAGLAVNFGGFGNNVVATILTKEAE
ncbi:MULTISPECIES: thiolase C-terminal domain-containing protein [Clostridium]|uniref:3-ketoacyl-CoA thiolase n=3 Tax=Clostridium TaxID=1485 RepID=D8GL62_CLOLD|nr:MULTISPECIES: beta-ketoacyl synthase N-terminal-like domain-containing protein [Clostridium]ADK15421.1 predicted acetyl-CoA acetyltransferase [Clostridium ljungdahlii DSM 13528]AGY74656.1 acetyl-CoA acetyltransferase [Clostridium autoethanogenum DSM 10061]ALU34838.1 Acetyl-CoA acetyltransferase [Clostridium autoethanogenum DSM 10061]OAA88522.1 3-ketoacyl-CoA thiolase [Clostridium ljungdahlii DSM 13528]OVY51559.1 3-ketoacyl-CoA thiolase [Clostridium autoethanogenum]